MKSNIANHCVRDVCTINPPLSAETDTSLPLLIFYMNLMKVGAAAVIDKENHCIGLIIGDDITDFFAYGSRRTGGASAKDVMIPPNMVVGLNAPLEQALSIMNMYKIDWLPVIDPDTKEFSGLVCRDDLENMSSNSVPFLKGKFLYEHAA